MKKFQKQIRFLAYFCFEKEIFFLKDGNLDNYLRLYDSNKNKSEISIDCQLEWTEQLINGIYYFHNVLNIIHRKIRPGYFSS